MKIRFCILAGLFLWTIMDCQGQSDSSQGRLYEIPDKVLTGLNNRATDMEQKIVKKTDRYLTRLEKLEEAFKKKCVAKDSVAAQAIFGNTQNLYSALRKKNNLVNNPFSNVYSSKLDSLKTGLHFLTKAGLLKEFQQQQEVTALLEKYNDLQSTLNQTETIKKYLFQRQQELTEQLEKLGVPGLKKLQKQVYYYRAQMEEYKRLWEDPVALKNKLMGLLRKLPEFGQFFDQYSDMGAVFQLPGNTTSSAANANLQSRDLLNRFVENIRGGAINAQAQVRNQLPAAPDQLSVVKSDIASLGSQGSGDMEMPSFKPNPEKVKSFVKRLEYGTTIQSTRANNFFPAISDLALSIGYRLNDKSVIGLAGSGKIGWGTGWRSINITGQGVSLRSFADIKLKGNWWVTGGWEHHYQRSFSSIRNLYNIDDWKQSALLGFTKSIPIKTKAFKKYRIQVLYDFLHKQKLPLTEPVKFRIGYTF